MPLYLFSVISLFLGAASVPTCLEDIPFLPSALLGYNIYTGSVFNPAGSANDPGIRNQIFQPLNANNTVHTAIARKPSVSCVSETKETVLSSLRQYQNYQLDTLVSGQSWKLGPQDLEITAGVQVGVANLEATRKIEPFYASDTFDSKESKGMEKFFTEEKGIVTVIESFCYMYQVNIDQHFVPDFRPSFIEKVRALFYSQEEHREEWFRHLIEEYGSHFATVVRLGKKMVYQRFFTSEEAHLLTQREILDCAEKHSKINMWIASRTNKSNSCSGNNGGSANIQSTNVRREIYSTYGSAIYNSVSEWSQSDPTKSVPLQLTLRPLILLFTPTNLEKIDPDIAKNATDFLQWLIPLYFNLTSVMGYKDATAAPVCNCTEGYQCIALDEDAFECEKLTKLYWLKDSNAGMYEIRQLSTAGKEISKTYADQCSGENKYCAQWVSIRDQTHQIIYEITPVPDRRLRVQTPSIATARWTLNSRTETVRFLRHPEARSYFITITHKLTFETLVLSVDQCVLRKQDLIEHEIFDQHFDHGSKCEIDVILRRSSIYLILVHPILPTLDFSRRTFFLEKFVHQSWH